MSPDEPEDQKPAPPATGAPEPKPAPRDPAAEAAALAALEAEEASAAKAAPKPAPKSDDDDKPAKAAADTKQADVKADAEADEKIAKAEAKAKKEADDKAKDEAEDKAKAEAKAKKEAEKKAEKEREEKEDKEREAREAAEALKKPPRAPPWYRTLRADPPALTRLALGLGLIIVVFGLWWFVTRGYDVQMQFNGRTKILEMKIVPSVDRIISASKLPSPGEVFGSYDTLLDRHLGDNTVATLVRVAKGIGMAAIVGILFGVLAAAHRGVNAALAPLVIFLRSVPMGALVPLTFMLFGLEEPQKPKFLFLAIVPFVFSDTVKAISIVPDRYIETAQTLGASRLQIIRKVLVPLALPDIITSLRFQLGLGLGYIMLAEETAELGLGKMINLSQRQGIADHVYLLLFFIAMLAFVMDFLLRTIQRGAFAWRKDL